MTTEIKSFFRVLFIAFLWVVAAVSWYLYFQYYSQPKPQAEPVAVSAVVAEPTNGGNLLHGSRRDKAIQIMESSSISSCFYYENRHNWTCSLFAADETELKGSGPTFEEAVQAAEQKRQRYERSR